MHNQRTLLVSLDGRQQVFQLSKLVTAIEFGAPPIILDPKPGAILQLGWFHWRGEFSEG